MYLLQLDGLLMILQGLLLTHFGSYFKQII
jgi:hypothetical protein